jgi:hypothetical protein
LTRGSDKQLGIHSQSQWSEVLVSEGGGQAVPENCKIWGLVADLSLLVANQT